MSRITTPFGARSTAAEVAEGLDLSGRRIVVTGASSGLGVETARALAGAGAELTLAVRDVQAGERTADELAASTGGRRPAVAELDLADQASVARFVMAWDGPLHVLVNNAGIMALPERRLTPEGWELQFATNHLGHFALALGLHGALAAAAGARVVSVSSLGHRQSPVVFEDLFFEHREYHPWKAYGQSKTANALFAVEATRRWAGDAIAVNALHPGGIFTNLQRHASAEQQAKWEEDRRAGRLDRMKTPEQGAATSVLLAASPLLEGVGGRYFEDCNEAVQVPDDHADPDGVRAHARDPEAARRLWDVSLQLLGRG